MIGYASTIANVHATVDGIYCNPSCSFQDNADGTTTWKDNNIAASKADSAAVANSENNVKCFAFCSGSSTANAASAATSNANSPTNTQTITKTKTVIDLSTVDTMPSLQRIKPTATECIDNTGSLNDEGYAQGYVDGNRDSVGLNGHSFDDSLHGKPTDQFRTGLKDRYQAGFSDGKSGINKNPC
jgi:hypothetical protein